MLNFSTVRDRLNMTIARVRRRQMRFPACHLSPILRRLAGTISRHRGAFLDSHTMRIDDNRCTSETRGVPSPIVSVRRTRRCAFHERARVPITMHRHDGQISLSLSFRSNNGGFDDEEREIKTTGGEEKGRFPGKWAVSFSP